MVNDVASANVPVPLDVQVVPALLVALDPAVTLTAPELEQVATAVPATAVGAAVIAILLPLSDPVIGMVKLTTLIL